MSGTRACRLTIFSALLSAVVSMAPVFADGQDNPPEPASPEATPKSPETAPATPASTTPAATSASSTETAPGPLLDKRKQVLAKIMAAKKQGTGISGYLAEYNRIEEMVKAGQPATAYEERLTSLQTGIDEQLKRSQILKTQHPTASFSSSAASSTPTTASRGGGGGGGISADTINDLKAKFGNKIPSDIGSKIGDMSPEQREKLLNSDMLKKFLNK